MHELKTDRRPLHIQARQHLLNLIEEGTYEPGEQLPSESNLAAQLGISRPTLREALFNLDQEGIIVRKHGVGTFVAATYGERLAGGLERLDSVLAMAERQGKSTRVLHLSVEETRADDRVAQRLEIAPGARLTRVRRTIAVDDTPAAYLVDFASTAVLLPEDLDASFEGSVLDLLVRRNATRVREAVAEITAINANDMLAEHLAIEPGEALLLLSETLFTGDAVDPRRLVPVDFSRNYFLPDVFDFRILRR